MRRTFALIICVGALYLTDAYYFDGVYFGAVEAVVSHFFKAY